MADDTFEQNEAALRKAWQIYLGGRPEAVRVFEAALNDGHESTLLYLIWAEVEKRRKRHDKAAAWYRKAIALSPHAPLVCKELAETLARIDRHDEAVEVLSRGLERTPESPPLLALLGMMYRSQGRLDEGIELVRRAVELAPSDHLHRTNLGVLMTQALRPEDAEREFLAGLALKPDDVFLLNNLAGNYVGQSRFAEAEALYRRAIAADPSYPDGPANYAALLRQSGRIGEAKSMYRKALAATGPSPPVHSNLIFCLDFDPDSGMAEQQAERARWRETVEAPLLARRYRHDATGDPDRKLRIGYVSADFRIHSAADMFGGVLLNHDLQRHDIILYSQNGADDERTEQFVAHATAMQRIRGLSDQAAAALIHGDRIDILVDLSGHSAGNRLPVFALKPAPVQVTAWGYATGTGLQSIDYFLADPWLIPEEMRPQFVETIVDLPCFLTYRAPPDLPPPGPSPHLAAGHVTFGCLNRLAKASPSCLETWVDLLRRVPDSRLILKCASLDDADMRARITGIFATGGVAPDRLDLRGRSPHAEHVRSYLEIDIALDPFPHCGGTTTCECLAMGVPVVSLCGDVPVARNGLSLLGALGQADWVAADRTGYLEKAMALAADSEGLQMLRAGLRDRVLASPLGDNIAYTRQVERVYRRLWQDHCRSVQVPGAAPAARPQ